MKRLQHRHRAHNIVARFAILTVLGVECHQFRLELLSSSQFLLENVLNAEELERRSCYNFDY
jgi:hypothetical protein